MKRLRAVDLIGIVLLIIGAGVLIRTACFVMSEDIWFDELFTVELAAKPMGEMLRLAARDVHPPLYYILVRLVYIITNKAFGLTVTGAAKLTAFLPYIFCLFLLLKWVRGRFGLLCCGIAFLFIETMPQMSAYMVEARMYSWSAFVLLAMFIHATELVNALEHESSNRTHGHIFHIFIYGVAAMYLHYYALIGAGVIAAGLILFCFIKKAPARIRVTLIICAALAIIAYIPWIGVLAKQIGQVSASYWIQPVTLRTIAGCVKYICMPQFESETLSIICAVVFVSAYIVMLILYAREYAQHAKSGRSATETVVSSDMAEMIYIFGCPLVTVCLVAVGMAASLIFRPVFVYRYMFPSMFIFWIGIAVLLSHYMTSVISICGSRDGEDAQKHHSQIHRDKAIVQGVLAAISVFLLILFGIRSYNLFQWEEERKIYGMERMSEVIEEVQSEYPDSLIVCNFNQVQALMWHYLANDCALWGYTDETLIADICGREPIIMVDDVDELRALVKETGRSDFLFIGSGNARDEIIEYWESEKIFTELLQDSCFLERYYFNIYVTSLSKR